MSPPARPLPATIAELRAAYRQGLWRVAEVVQACMDRTPDGDPAWIRRASPAEIAAELQRLDGKDPATLPLYGIPFAVKDNIDVAGWPTTAACPAFAYTAAQDATCVQRLRAAGAVLIGKTNLDQFATGLVGTRSPYGAVPNSFDAQRISGGSSSGSAVVVARGEAVFALGTDTAGSGRVPAGFNNLVGLKPSPGRVPMQGVLPACRSLDVVSVFALTVADAAQVMAVIEEPPADEPLFHRPVPRPAWFAAPLRVRVPAEPVLDGALGYDQAFATAVERLRRHGALIEPLDMEPLYEVARLLYEGPWVAERYAVVQALIESRPEALDPAVREVLQGARRHDAVAAFRAQYRLRELATRLEPLWQQADLLVVPTAPTLPTLAEVAAAPLARNSELGRYTNFVNLLGWAALAVPAGFTAAGLPFGITAIGPAGSDAALAAWGATWQHELQHDMALPLGAGLVGRTPGPVLPEDAAPRAAPSVAVAVVGAHLQGLPLHGQLVERGCRLRARTRTAPQYRLFELPDSQPPKPGLLAVAEGGRAIEVEVYDMPLAGFGSFVALIPPPLAIGTLRLADGSAVKGFVCEAAALAGARDISDFGGWRAYLGSR